MKYGDKNRRKSERNIPTLKLSELEQEFIEELKLYDQVIDATILISLNQHGIQTDGRGLRGVRIFTRQTIVGISLQKILPHPSTVQSHKDDLWDISSIASLSRNILEGYLSLYYYTLENITEEESELRFYVAQLHSNVEWYHIRKQINPSDPGLNKYLDGINSQKERIKNHKYLNSLTAEQKNKAKKGNEIYYTKSDFESKNDICEGLTYNYRMLSNLVHPVPLAIERIDDINGRGIASDMDINYCKICLMIARRFLASSTVDIVDHFSNEFSAKIKDKINNIRPLIKTGF